MNKQDRRFQRTDDIIKREFINISKEKKDINKVTVTEICNRANINRCTFYLHYETIQHLIEHLEHEYAQKLIDACAVYNYNKETEYFFESIFDAVKNNPELFHFYFFISNGGGMNLLEEYLHDNMISMWMKHSEINENEAKLVLRFLLKGAMELLREWYINDFNNEESIKKIFDSLIKHGLYSLAYL